MLFVSHARRARVGDIPDVGPLEAAPELVAEIISNSETQRILGGKIEYYISIDVEECWVVTPAARTVEVLRLTPGGPESVATYDETQTLVSRVFPELSFPAAEVFRP